MKRRSFLQGIGAAVAALFVPKAAAKTNADYLTDPAKWFIKSESENVEYFGAKQGVTIYVSYGGSKFVERIWIPGKGDFKTIAEAFAAAR